MRENGTYSTLLCPYQFVVFVYTVYACSYEDFLCFFVFSHLIELPVAVFGLWFLDFFPLIEQLS